MKKIISRYRYLLFPLSSGVVIVFLSLIFVLPQIREVQQLREEFALQSEKLTRLSRKLAQLQSFDPYELEEKVRKAERVLPSQKAVVSFLFTLSRLSEETEVNLVSFKASPGQLAVEKDEEMEIQVTVLGKPEKINLFLERLKKTAPLMKAATFSQKEIRGEETEAAMLVIAFISPLPASLGKIDQPLPTISSREEALYQEIAQWESFAEVLPVVGVGRLNPFAPF